MDRCDVLIAGGGPAGSSCAWALRHSGLNVLILDKQVFPRNKVCGGWITPEALTALEIDPVVYGQGRTLQPITSFRTSSIRSGPQIETDYGRTVSYGILRSEFDEYLLRRCGAQICDGVPLTSLQRNGSGWLANGKLQARMVVGAGGHFCPVARMVNDRENCMPVAAQETEFEMTADQQAECNVRGECPELYFCADMKGYGWCFRKGNVLNVGLGRADAHRLPEHVHAFVGFLTKATVTPFELPPMKGHAYFLSGTSPRQNAGDGFLLIGDSAGLARPQSGEGILPAIKSGLLAGEAIVAARGDYRKSRMKAYREPIESSIAKDRWAMRMACYLPPRLTQMAAGRLLENRWFSRHVILDRWFLH